jgi:hypothetical protein
MPASTGVLVLALASCPALRAADPLQLLVRREELMADGGRLIGQRHALGAFHLVGRGNGDHIAAGLLTDVPAVMIAVVRFASGGLPGGAGGRPTTSLPCLSQRYYIQAVRLADEGSASR